MSNELDQPSDLGDYLAARDEGTAGEIDDSLVDIGGRIAEARRLAGTSQAELGAQLGVTEVTVAAWEEGRLATRSNVLVRVAGLLGVSLSWLVMGHGVSPADGDAPELHELQQTLLDVRAQLTSLADDLGRVAAGLADAAR
jgi:transcriptional regulator with XRE-family HTH domain